MKKALFTILVLVIVCSCTKGPKSELSEEQKSAIKSEIQRLFEYAGEGITELNAEKAFSMFSTKEGAKYVRDGKLYPSIETAKNEYAGWFKSPNSVKRKIICDPMIFDILDEKTVLLTTIGSLVAIDDTTNQKPWVIAYTMLWRKEDEGWRLFHMHNSWE
jgi:hypothetical protein